MKENIEKRECEEYLQCILADYELIMRSRELAKANEDLSDVQARKKDVTADFNAQEKKHEANIGVLARVVSTGKEYRHVKCEWEYNWTKGVKKQIRLDTNDTIKEQPIDKSERQTEAELK